MDKHVNCCLQLLDELPKLKSETEISDLLIDLTHRFKVLVEHQAATEDVLLCFHQIATCLPFCAGSGNAKNAGLYFQDRVRYCLLQLRVLINCGLRFSSEPPSNVIAQLENMINSNILDNDYAEIFKLVNSFISQVLHFQTLALDEDKQKITDLCRYVLSKLSKPGNNENGIDMTDDTNAPDIAGLKQALLLMENLLSECVLRLFVHTIVTLHEDPLTLQPPWNSFDLLVDRLIQIGIIGITFAESPSGKNILTIIALVVLEWEARMKRASLPVRNNLRSAVASLESLDVNLPAFISEFGGRRKGAKAFAVGSLEMHWREETTRLANNMYKIIDTKRLCACLVEWISRKLGQTEAEANQQNGVMKSSGVAALNDILKMCWVFEQHLSLNEPSHGREFAALAFERNSRDIKIMLKECKAAVKYCEKMDNARIFKRFRLLLHTLEVIQKELTNDNEGSVSSTLANDTILEFAEMKAIATDDTTIANAMHTRNVTASHHSRVFYRPLAKESEFNWNICLGSHSNDNPFGESKITIANRVQRNYNSIFSMKGNPADESLNLDITEILEKLSQTFKNRHGVREIGNGV